VANRFYGGSRLSLDAKGRMQVPAKHRDALTELCEGQLTITRHPQGCLMLFPRPYWEVHRERVAAWPADAQVWKRIILGDAEDVEIDASGRILISADLREAVGISKDIKLLGLGGVFEIWDAPTLKGVEDQAAKDVPPSISLYSFSDE
jgi:MraZ protein